MQRQELLLRLGAEFNPSLLVLAVEPERLAQESQIAGILRGKATRAGSFCAYLCKQQSCGPQLDSAQAVLAELARS